MDIVAEGIYSVVIFLILISQKTRIRALQVLWSSDCHSSYSCARARISHLDLILSGFLTVFVKNKNKRALPFTWRRSRNSLLLKKIIAKLNVGSISSMVRSLFQVYHRINLIVLQHFEVLLCKWRVCLSWSKTSDSDSSKMSLSST